MATPTRRSTRTTKGKSPSRLGVSDGFFESKNSDWISKDAVVEEDEVVDEKKSDESEMNVDTAADVPSSSPSTLSSTGIVILVVIAILNVAVLVYCALCAAGFEKEIKGYPPIYAAAAFAICGAGAPLYFHLSWVVADGKNKDE